jgi:aldehyde dehydrogenase (NAD+)
MKYLNNSEIESVFNIQKEYAQHIKESSINSRKEKLSKIIDWIEIPENRQKIIDALHHDMKRPLAEIIGGEIATVILSLRILKKNLSSWLKPKRLPLSISLIGNKSHIQYESLGNTLIISPWNYPFQLAIVPMAFSIAAGNTVIIKPSEYSAHTAKIIEKLVNDLFKQEEVKVIQGEVPETTKLLSLPFNHIYFTGSPNVGKIIMEAAAKNLASVTLELGGKSPCIVDETASIKAAAKSIMWGKCYNAGQTCIAPDYILIDEKIKAKFITEAKDVLAYRYGNSETELAVNKDFGRIISAHHWNRSKSLLDDALDKGAKIEFGGYFNEETKFISPTLLTNTNPDMRIRKEEIFCPLLPIIAYKSLDQAISIINTLPKALTMYIFSKSKKNTNTFIDKTSAGTTLINDTLIHFANEYLPFGGVNNSGIGKSHGKYSLYAFMNERSIMKQVFNTTSVLHPPYTNRTLKILNFLSKL